MCLWAMFYFFLWRCPTPSPPATQNISAASPLFNPACSASTEQSCSHLTGHSDLGFGRRLRPQSVRLGVHEAHSDEEGSEQPAEEGVVPKELGGHVHISQHLPTGNSFNLTQQNILDTKQQKKWLEEAVSYFLVESVPSFPQQQSDHPLHLIWATEHTAVSQTVWTLDQTRAHYQQPQFTHTLQQRPVQNLFSCTSASCYTQLQHSST